MGLKVPREMTLDQALEWIAADELVEVTPKSVRVRKAILDSEERKKAGKRELGRPLLTAVRSRPPDSARPTHACSTATAGSSAQTRRSSSTATTSPSEARNHPLRPLSARSTSLNGSGHRSVAHLGLGRLQALVQLGPGPHPQDRALILDLGKRVQPVITPDDVDKVAAIIRSKTG